jgi:asparaginyl-tRNA synthetase
MTYTEAIDVLRSPGREFEFPVKWGTDLQTEHERYLTEEALQAAGGGDELPQGHQGLLHAP